MVNNWEYWQSHKTGEIYAVKVAASGTIVGATGPLIDEEFTWDNISEHSIHFVSNPGLVGFMEENYYKFKEVFPPRKKVKE